MKYPSNLIAKDWVSKTPNWHALVYIGENRNTEDNAVSIGIEKGINTLEQLYEKSFAPKIREQDMEDALIGENNYRVKKFSYKGPAHELPEEVDFVIYFIEHSDFLYQIFYDRRQSKPGAPSPLSENTFNQILSTFKFIE